MKALLKFLTAWLLCLSLQSATILVHGPVGAPTGGGLVTYTDGFAGTLANWTSVGDGPWSIVTAQLQHANTAGNQFGVIKYTGASFHADQFSQVKFIAGNSVSQTVEVGVRVTGTGGTFGGYFAGLDNSGNWKIYKTIATVDTTLTSGTRTLTTANDVFRLEVVGTALTFKINGTTVGTTTDASLSSGTTSINVFQGTNATTSTFDDATGGEL